jgi:hypothetical protein
MLELLIAEKLALHTRHHRAAPGGTIWLLSNGAPCFRQSGEVGLGAQEKSHDGPVWASIGLPARNERTEDLEQPNPGRGAAPGQHVSHPYGPKRPVGELN